MPNEVKCDELRPIRDVVLKWFERMRQTVLPLTPLVNLEEHPYAWGISWSVSALSSAESDETSATVVVRLETAAAEVQADVSFANSMLMSLAPVRFLVTDLEAPTRAAGVIDEFFARAAPRFEESCRTMAKENALGGQTTS